MSVTARLATACPLDCPDTCSLEVTVEDGRLVAIDAGPANPLTQGFICAKVKHHARRVYAPERVLTPLVRVGAKGAGDFRSATWDEALDLVASRVSAAIAEDGPSSVVPYLYNSSAGSLAAEGLTWRMFDELGAARVLHTICAATAGAAWQSTFGAMLAADPLDVVHSKLVIVWGANPAISNIHFPPLVQQARAQGARLVVVDPRRTAMARRADRHLALQPGTDVALVLGMVRHLDRNGPDRPIVRRRARDRSRGADRRLGRVDAVAHRGGDRRRRGRHRRLRRGARDDPSRVRAHRVGDRAEPQRWRVVSGGARAAGADGSARRARVRCDGEPEWRRRLRAERTSLRRPAEGQHERARHRAAADARAFRPGLEPCRHRASSASRARRPRARRPLHRRARPGAHRHRALRRRRVAGHDALRSRRPRRLVRFVHAPARSPPSSTVWGRVARTTRWVPASRHGSGSTWRGTAPIPMHS